MAKKDSLIKQINYYKKYLGLYYIQWDKTTRKKRYNLRSIAFLDDMIESVKDSDKENFEKYLSML